MVGDGVEIHGEGGCFLVEFVDVHGRTRAWSHGKPLADTVKAAKSEAMDYVPKSAESPLIAMRIRQFSACPNSGATDDAINDQRITIGPNLDPI